MRNQYHTIDLRKFNHDDLIGGVRIEGIYNAIRSGNRNPILIKGANVSSRNPSKANDMFINFIRTTDSEGWSMFTGLVTVAFDGDVIYMVQITIGNSDILRLEEQEIVSNQK